MAKNLVKNNKQPIAAEPQMGNMEARAASGNLEMGAAYNAPLKNNMKRMQEAKHMGAMPNSGNGQF